MLKASDKITKNKLISYCKSINIECVGIAPKGPYYSLLKILQSRRNKGCYTSFEDPNLNNRINPSITMKDVQSIIVCLFPYYVGDVNNSNISKYTYSIDYHIIIKNKLNKIARYLKENIPDFKYMCFTDKGPLVDRYLAYISGLGYYGLNGNIINDTYGSYVFIGYIINNYPFIPDNPLDKSCLNCNACIDQCPANAILPNYGFNPKLCISYLSQKKTNLTPNETVIFKANKKVFGCDICQEVCPHNINIPKTIISDFTQDLIFQLNEEEIKLLSNKQFKNNYGNRAFAWRGKNIILRNFELI